MSWRTVLVEDGESLRLKLDSIILLMCNFKEKFSII